MSIEVTKAQKQALGKAIKQAGYEPDEFVYTETVLENSENEAALLTNRETSERFAFYPRVNNYKVQYDVPGTSKIRDGGFVGWDELLVALNAWASEVKREHIAVDPWAQEAEDMANDDSHFTISELPKVDHAIDEAIEELKDLAIQNGKKLSEIEGDLSSVKNILKKTARQTTKKEWITLFKGVILEKIIDWGMQTELFQVVLHKLITSVQDVAQLAEHASRLLI